MWFDEGVVESVTGSLPVWMAILLLLISYLGSVYLIAPAAVVAYLRGSDWRTATWPGIIVGAYALFVALKPITDITRPSERGVDSPLADETMPAGIDLLHQYAVEFDTASFPSGHAIAATVFAALLVVDLDVGTFRQRLAAGSVYVGAVSVSRVGLGVHYVGDMVGGILIALVFLAVVFSLRQRLNARPWRTIDAPQGVMMLAMVPAAGAIVIGRPFDGTVLLVAAAGAICGHRVLQRDEIAAFNRRLRFNDSSRP